MLRDIGNIGLALPNLKYYFWAAQLRSITIWIADDESTRWLKTEKSLSMQVKLTNLLFSGHKINADAVDVWSRFSMKIWREVLKELKLPSSTSCSTSIRSIGDFAPSILDAGFRGWRMHGLTYIHQLFHSSQLKSFDQLREEFNLPRSDFLDIYN